MEILYTNKSKWSMKRKIEDWNEPSIVLDEGFK